MKGESILKERINKMERQDMPVLTGLVFRIILMLGLLCGVWLICDVLFRCSLRG